MGGTEGQTYCLRWNNHKSNLVEILDVLIQKECYVDCTIYVDGQEQFKAHRVVLAANSPYFQSILQDVPMDHCSILVPGVQPFEMRALIEYMYTGEVNVTQSQIPRIMKIAEQLEVKGLFDMTDLKDKFNKMDDTSTQSANNHHNNHHHHHPHNLIPPQTTPPHTPSTNSNNNKLHLEPSSPLISTSANNITSTQSGGSSSPPYNYKTPYSSIFSHSSVPLPSSVDRLHPWPMTTHMPTSIPPSPHLQSAAAAMLSSVYESGSDMNPLKRKKLSSISSMLMSRDTPILRNVLAQPNVADSSQPVPLVCAPPSNDRSDRQSTHSNGTDYSDKKYDEPHSPYIDKSFDDDLMDTSHSYTGSDSRLASYVPQQQKPEWKRYKQYTRTDILSAIDCVRNGMSALQASRKYGVPSRTLYDKVKKLGITTARPMNRTIKRSPSNGGSPAGFPYGISGTSSPYGHHDNHNQSHVHSQSQSMQNDSSERDSDRSGEQQHQLPPSMSHPAAALLDAALLQQALEARGGDIAGRELHAMALAAAAHAAVNGMSTSPGTHGTARSPSPSILLKYMRPTSPRPPSMQSVDRLSIDHDRDRMSMEREREHDVHRDRENNHHSLHHLSHHPPPPPPAASLPPSSSSVSASLSSHLQQTLSVAEEDRVEDLSMGKKNLDLFLPTPHGVIVPPMTTKLQSSHNIDSVLLNVKREQISDDDPHN